jgi:AcrR family transcriptional regulator
MSPIPRQKKLDPQPRGDAFVRLVLEASLVQLAEVGFERLSIPEIAAIVGVNKTSIYRRWPSKTELIHEALKDVMGHADSLPDTGELRGDLLALADTVAGFIESTIGRAVVGILLAESGNPAVRELALMAYGETAKHGPWLILSRAEKRGDLKQGLDPSLILFAIAGAIIHRVFIEKRESNEEFLTQLVDLVLSGAVANSSMSTAR